MIYKKGNVSIASNYRAISIASALPKLYDNILNDKFTTWYMPLDEQAGAQVGRGCTEQVLTLQLWIDYARKEKKVFYVLFIDNVKAYNRTNRIKL